MLMLSIVSCGKQNKVNNAFKWLIFHVVKIKMFYKCLPKWLCMYSNALFGIFSDIIMCSTWFFHVLITKIFIC